MRGGFALARRSVPGTAPTDFGYRAWTGDPLQYSATAILVSQQVSTMRVPVPETFTCSNAYVGVSTVGASMTYAHVAIFDEAGTTQLGISTTLTTALTAAGRITCPMASAVNLQGGVGRHVIVAILTDGGTPPTLYVANTSGGAYASFLNGGQSPLRCATQSAQASMPASLTLTSGQRSFWVGLA
jgi:hypothetical protein